jgi:integrase
MANIEKRTAKDRSISYRVKVRLKGYPDQTATFERLTDAKKWAQHTEAAIREGRHFKTSEAKRHTLGEMIDRYLREVMPAKAKSEHQQKPQLEWWKAQLGDYSLADITPPLIAQYRDKLATEPYAQVTVGEKKEPRYRGPSTVIRYMSALSHVFTVAVKEWQWVDDSPVRKVTKPTPPRGRVRFLSDREREALLDACAKSSNKDLYTALVLALSTGARRMEIMGLRWGQVDISRGFITLTETKNGEIRALPLASKALELMKERSKVRRIDTDLVFPGSDPKKPIDLRAPFESALKQAKLDNFHWHDLRHTCASYLAMNGASLAEIAEVLGHKTLQMVKRYAHLSQAHTARVVASMNDKIFGGVSG